MKQTLVILSASIASVSAFAPLNNPQHHQGVVVSTSTTTTLQMKPQQTTETTTTVSNRRQALSNIFGAVTTTGLIASSTSSTFVANALDMDAFINSELANDSKKKEMSGDEATCKYGQGKAKVEACKRLKEAGKDVPKENQGKSLGGAYAM